MNDEPVEHIERQARVIAVAEDHLRLRVFGQCSGCTGCGGRCDLLAGWHAGADDLRLPRSALIPPLPQPGQIVCLRVSSRSLLADAWQGYGWPLAGLLIGVAIAAAGGSLIDGVLASYANAVSLFAAIAGTFLGVLASKRQRVQRLRRCVEVRWP